MHRATAFELFGKLFLACCIYQHDLENIVQMSFGDVLPYREAMYSEQLITMTIGTSPHFPKQNIRIDRSIIRSSTDDMMATMATRRPTPRAI